MAAEPSGMMDTQPEVAVMAEVAQPAQPAVAIPAQAAPNPNVGGSNHPRLTIGADDVVVVKIALGNLGANGYLGGYVEIVNSMSGTVGDTLFPTMEDGYFVVRVGKANFANVGTYYAKLSLTYEPAEVGGYNRQEVIMERLLEVYRSEVLIQYPEDQVKGYILGFDNW